MMFFRHYSAALLTMLFGWSGSLAVSATTIADVVAHSHTILEIALTPRPPWATFRVVRAVKGQLPAATSRIATIALPAGYTNASSQVPATNASLALWFNGDYSALRPAQNPTSGFLHWNGRWYGLEAGIGPSPPTLTLADDLTFWWDGATPLAAAAVDYVLKRQTFSLPDRLTTRWSDPEKIGHIPGAVKSIVPVDLHRNGSLSLFFATTSGDHILRRQADRESFEHVIPGSTSDVAIWTDLNNDGRLDLVSAHGRQVRGWMDARNGSYNSNLFYESSAVVTGLLNWWHDGRAAIVVSGESSLQLLSPVGRGNSTPHPSFLVPSNWMTHLGPTRALQSAYFDDDNFPDLLQFTRNGIVLWLGRTNGLMERSVGLGGVKLEANSPSPAWADFDADGHLDLAVASARGTELWLHAGGTNWQEMTAGAGQLGRLGQKPCSHLSPGDLNNDGWIDLILFHPDEGPSVFLNRGFGSLQRLDELAPGRWIPNAARGQQAGLIVDLDHDGAQDLVMVLRNGDVWLLRRSVAEQAALSVRALQDLTAKKGPARVTLQDALGPKQLGVVDMGGPGAFFGVQSSGPVTLSWQFPGGALVEKSIVIEEGEFRIWLGDGFPRTR